MKSTKKFFSVVMLLVVTFVFSGCVRTQLPNFEVPEEGYDGSEVTITFYHTMGQNLRDVLDEAITAFNKIYPNIKVVHSQVGDYDDVRDQIKTEISEKNQPNLAYCYPDHVALYNKSRAVVELDALIESTIPDENVGDGAVIGMTQAQIDDFIQGYWNEGRQFGNDFMYTIPFSKSTEVLYYNETYFNQHNLKVPTTWDEMEEVCAKIKEIDTAAGVLSTPLGYDSSSNWFITMCEQYGSPYTSATGNHFLFDNDVNNDFLFRFAQWYKKGYLTTQEIYGSYTSGLFKQQSADEPRSYMSIGSSAGATHQRPDKITNAAGEQVYPFEVGIASIPQVDAANPKVISQGPSVCIFKSENPQEVVASWLLLKYLTTNISFQAAFALASGYVPVIKSVENDENYAAEMAKAREALANTAKGNNDVITSISALICLQQERAYYTSPAFVGSSTARDQVGILLDAALTASLNASSDEALKKSIKDAFAIAIDECEYAAN